MKNLFFVFSLLVFLFNNSFAQDVEIKSLEVYTTAERLALPVVQNGEKLVIEFDIQSDFEPSLKIVFRFCDYGWEPTNNSFLFNSNRNFLTLFDFERLPVTVEDAEYHFKGSYPDRDGFVEFPFSGKWKFFITDLIDQSIVFAEGKFFVVDSEVNLYSKIKNDELEDKVYWPKELAKVFNITTEFYLPDDFHPDYVDRLDIIENKLINYPVTITRNDNSLGRQFKWDASRKFTFIARDILAGNEYRQADLRNANYFVGKDVKAQRDGLELSRFFLKSPKDLNGNLIYTEFNNPDATYLNVTFSIRPPDDVYGEIFLTGAFNEWELLSEYKMAELAGIYSITIPIKRGVYDYQYVVADDINGEMTNPDWVILEGNTWSNRKEYNIFLYYNETQLGGYERIIGYYKIPGN